MHKLMSETVSVRLVFLKHCVGKKHPYGNMAILVNVVRPGLGAALSRDDYRRILAIAVDAKRVCGVRGQGSGGKAECCRLSWSSSEALLHGESAS
jgi:hypothetical protein